MILPWIAELAFPLFFVAVAMVVAGLIVSVTQVIRLIPVGRKRGAKPGVMGRFVRSLLGVCVVLFGLFLLMLVMFVRSYEVFTREKLVARIHCVPVESQDYTMILRFAPLTERGEGPAALFRLKGDQWAVGGHILRWHPWLNILGLDTGYQITRLEGRYLHAEDEPPEGRTVYDLGERGMQRLWEWIYRYHEGVPWVEAAYGSTIYTFPDEDKVFLVAVTTSGFTVTSKGVP